MIQPASIVETLRNYEARHPVRRWVVAYSGGVDSRVLLELIHLALDDIHSPTQFPARRLVALHINHQLHPDADKWQQHCEIVCAGLNVTLSVREVRVKLAGSLETQARSARYDAFRAFLESGDALLMAHHKDDQLETALFRLMRGEGYQGMPRERLLGNGRIFRPLLDHTRIELETWARQRQLNWIEDGSNQDVQHDRNFIRHELVPRLLSRWPRLQQGLSASLVRETANQQLIDEVGEEDLVRCHLAEPERLVVNSYLSLTAPRRHNMVRSWLTSLGLPLPSGSSLMELDRQLLAAGDAMPDLRWQGIELRRYRGELHLMHKLVELPSTQLVDERGRVLAPHGVLLHLPAHLPVMNQYGEMSVRYRQGGETLQSGSGHRRPLKKLLQEGGIPPWLRNRIPLIFSGDRLLLVPCLPQFELLAIRDDVLRFPIFDEHNMPQFSFTDAGFEFTD